MRLREPKQHEGGPSLQPGGSCVRSFAELSDHFMCSAALKRLMGMAGRSLAIYNGLADLCRVRLRDSESPYCGVKEASYCTLRSQLLMALHDNNISEITSKVSVFSPEAVWSHT